MFSHLYNIAIGTDKDRTVYSANCTEIETKCDSDARMQRSIPAQMTIICTDQCTYEDACNKSLSCIHRYIEIDYYCRGNSIV